jgi:hAT family C-terminal dimerisation region
MQNACWTHWKEEYSGNYQPRPLPPDKQSIIDDFLVRPQKNLSKDEFEMYIRQTPSAVDPLIPLDLIEWWWNNQCTFPTLYQDALDKLAIPAMSAECERVFSSAKKMITQERNSLAEDIIQACECLKSWWDTGVIAE